MVNTVVELRKEQHRVSDIYDRYFGNMKASYLIVLENAIQLNEIKYPQKKNIMQIFWLESYLESVFFIK